MQLIDESTIARGMIRVEPGEDLVSALEALAFAAGWREAFVTGAGTLDLVELQVGAEVVSLERAEVVSLAGHLVHRGDRSEARLTVQVLASGRTLSGRVVAAVTGPILLIVEAALFASAKIGHAPKEVPAARTSSPSFGPGGASFGAKPVVVPRGRAESSDDDVEEEHWMDVSAGDAIEHPNLGRGDVLGDDPSGGTRVRLATGRACVLRLDTLDVLAPTVDESGQRVFRITGPKRKR